MPIVQNIDGIPAYTTIEEALQWGSQFGVTSYHTHLINGQTAYMAGVTHDEVISAIRSGTEPINIPSNNVSSSGSSSSSSSSSGGY